MPSITHLKPPVYHRQRLLLFLLDAAGGALSKLDFQKLLFLYVNDQDDGSYEFIPYKYGCYSFLAADDLDLLAKRGWAGESEHEYTLCQEIHSADWARSSPQYARVKRWLPKQVLRGEELIQHSYHRFPFFAQNSVMRERLLDRTALRHIDGIQSQQQKTSAALFTLGYEGIHFEAYINQLIRNGVDTLCDVRRNPLSRKFGFSSRTLGNVLPKLGIQYIHIPSLGIASGKRKGLEAKEEFEVLFEEYREDLPGREEGLSELRDMIRSGKRIALTCFEAHHRDCHRHCITDLLAREDSLEIKHL